MENIGLTYKIPLRLLTGHKSLGLTDFPFYEHRNKTGN